MEKLAEGYGLVEAPIWIEGEGLMFSDVLNGGAYCLGPAGEVKTVFAHRRGMGGMRRHVDGGMIVSGRNISWKSIPEGETRTVLDRDESAGLVGFNDITADAAGRIYAGGLGASPVFEDGREPQSGDLYLIDLDGTSRVVAEDIRLSNGLAFSPDGTRLYYSDSRRQRVNYYDVAEDGTLGLRETFASVDEGVPDGLCVSEDGRVWVALAGGHGVGVFSASGEWQELLKIPQPMCTSVCFGGDDRRDLYVVSGSEGSGENSGAVYRASVDAVGLPVPVARVRLPAPS